MIFFFVVQKRQHCIVFLAPSFPSPHLSKKGNGDYCEWLSSVVVDVLCSDVGYSSEPSDVV